MGMTPIQPMAVLAVLIVPVVPQLIANVDTDCPYMPNISTIISLTALTNTQQLHTIGIALGISLWGRQCYYFLLEDKFVR